MFVIDGNFTAVHLRQKNPENDVFLSDGTGYMTGRKRYLNHLRAAEGWVEVWMQRFLPSDYANCRSPRTMIHVTTSVLIETTPSGAALTSPALVPWHAVGMGSMHLHPQWISKRGNSKFEILL